MSIETIRQLVRNKRYQIKLHALQHAIKEGFGEQEMIDVILSGRIIENYQDRPRVLICGQITLESNITIHLHVVCEQNYADQIEFVTAYIPDERDWEKPPVQTETTKKMMLESKLKPPFCSEHHMQMVWDETDFTYAEDGVEVVVRHIPAWVCPHGDDAAFPPGVVDELIETIRELIAVAKRTQAQRPSLLQQEYLVKVMSLS